MLLKDLLSLQLLIMFTSAAMTLQSNVTEPETRTDDCKTLGRCKKLGGECIRQTKNKCPNKRHDRKTAGLGCNNQCVCCHESQNKAKSKRDKAKSKRADQVIRKNVYKAHESGKHWTSSQCFPVSSFSRKVSLESCWLRCNNKENCTAFDHNKILGRCRLRNCPLPAPEPAYPRNGYTGYSIDRNAGRKQCVNGTFKCVVKNEYYPCSKICDGDEDCRDYSDEIECDFWPEIKEACTRNNAGFICFYLDTSNQCFCIIPNLTNWSGAQMECWKRGWKIARPFDAIALQNQLTQRYGILKEFWLYAQSDNSGDNMIWKDNEAKLWFGNSLICKKGTHSTFPKDSCLTVITQDLPITDCPYIYQNCSNNDIGILCEKKD